MGYRLEKRDLEQIDSLIKTTKSIETLYRRMYELEIKGEKNTEEFKKLLDYLSIALEVENKNYMDFNLYGEKAKAWSDYLLNKVPKNFLNDLESAAAQDHSNKVYRRILNVLFDKITGDASYMKNMFSSPIEDLFKMIGIPGIDETIEKNARESKEMNDALEKDTYASYLFFLNEVLNKKEYEMFKEQLIKSKYYISFIEKKVEDSMLFTNFDIADELYLNSKLSADLLKIGIDEYKLMKIAYAKGSIMHQIASLLHMSDWDYNDKTQALTSIFRQCLMRAGFMLLDDETISDLNYDFHELIEAEQYLNDHRNDKISPQLIINCFRSIKNDKNKANIVSLKLKPE